MKETGGDQYKLAHNNSRNRKKETGLPIDLRANLEDYNRCVAHVNAWVYDRLYS